MCREDTIIYGYHQYLYSAFEKYLSLNTVDCVQSVRPFLVGPVIISRQEIQKK